MPYVVRLAGESTRITTNCKKLFIHALGKKLTALDNMTGAQAYHDLWPAIAMLYRPDDRETLLAMENAKGYGTLKQAGHFLFEILQLCSESPDEILSVEVI